MNPKRMDKISNLAIRFNDEADMASVWCKKVVAILRILRGDNPGTLDRNLFDAALFLLGLINDGVGHEIDCVCGIMDELDDEQLTAQKEEGGEA